MQLVENMRLIKTPKLVLGDIWLACTLLGVDAEMAEVDLIRECGGGVAGVEVKASATLTKVMYGFTDW